MHPKNHIHPIVCLVFTVLYLITDIIMIASTSGLLIKWSNRRIHMLENGIVRFEKLINLFICPAKNSLFRRNNVTWRLYYNEIFKTNTISAIFWSFHSVKDLILFIKDKINRNYRMQILYIEAMYEN